MGASPVKNVREGVPGREPICAKASGLERPWLVQAEREPWGHDVGKGGELDRRGR